MTVAEKSTKIFPLQNFALYRSKLVTYNVSVIFISIGVITLAAMVALGAAPLNCVCMCRNGKHLKLLQLTKVTIDLKLQVLVE